MATPPTHDPLNEQPLVAHLIELRNRLVKALIGVLVVLVPLLFFANEIYTVVAKPLMAVMPPGASMIATEVTSTFLAPFKLVLILAIFLAMPVVLYQVWAFIAPGLYRHERRLLFPLLAASIFLFYLGAAFAYFLVFPLMFAFFASTAPEGVTMMTDISSYLDFVLAVFLAFGIAFQVPIVTIVLVWTGMVTPETLRKSRRYVIVLAFVIGAVLTPPDIFSQTLLAVPMILLFEIGLFFTKYFVKKDTSVGEITTTAPSPIPVAGAAAASSGMASKPEPEFDMDAEFERAQEDERRLAEGLPPRGQGKPNDQGSTDLSDAK